MKILKRAIDILGASILLILLLPLLLLVAIIIKVDSRGPAIFKQIRVGKDKKNFMFYKFRSMCQDSSPDIHKEYIEKLMAPSLDNAQRATGGVYKLVSDGRVTRVGRFIRRTSIDELPQLFNVVKGDMSLVGPRPAIPYELEHYDERMLKRFSVKPGITGLWQVSARNTVDYKKMIEMDIEYINNWSLWLDMKILFKTIPVVLKPKNVY